MTESTTCGVIVNPFYSQSPFVRSQEIEITESLDDPAVKKALEAYVQRHKDKTFDPNSISCLDPLSPLQIDTLLQHVMIKYLDGNLYWYETGMFFSKLIQDSVAKLDHHDFMLSTHDRWIPWLGKNMPKATNVTVYGNMGVHSGSESQESSFDIRGSSCSQLGTSSIDCKYIVAGDIGDFCGYRSVGCKFLVHGNVLGRLLGYKANRSVFTVNGAIGERPLEDAAMCTLKTPDEDTYKHACSKVPKNNLVLLVGKSGDIISQRNLR